MQVHNGLVPLALGLIPGVIYDDLFNPGYSGEIVNVPVLSLSSPEVPLQPAGHSSFGTARINVIPRKKIPPAKASYRKSQWLL
jgi:hypothetical protein